MGAGIVITPLTNFNLENVDKVYLALSTIGESIIMGAYREMIQVEKGKKDKWYYSTESGDKFIFNSILLIDEESKYLAYAVLDPQTLDTVKTWYVTLALRSEGSEIEGGSVVLDYIYNEHTIATNQGEPKNKLNNVHTDLRNGSAFDTGPSGLNLYGSLNQSALAIQPDIINLSRTFEQLSIPRIDSPEASKSLSILHFIHGDNSDYQYFTYDGLNSAKSQSFTHQSFTSETKVRAFMSTSLGVYNIPALVKYLIDDDEDSPKLTTLELAECYKYASIFSNGERNFGFFLPLLKQGKTGLKLVGCVLLPSGAFREITYYKFDPTYEFNTDCNLIPAYYKYMSLNVIQFGDGKSVYWNDPRPDDPGFPAAQEGTPPHVNTYSGFEHAWLDEGNKGTSGDSPAEYPYIIYKKYANITGSGDICMSPSLCHFGYYLELKEDAPTEIECLIHYCVDTRESIADYLKRYDENPNVLIVPRNYVSYTLFNALKNQLIQDHGNPSAQDPSQETIDWWAEYWTEDLNSTSVIMFSLKHQNVSVPSESPFWNEVNKVLKYDNIIDAYKETDDPYNNFQNFKNEYGPQIQTIAKLSVIATNDEEGEGYLDRIPDPPGSGSDNYSVYALDPSMEDLANTINSGIKIMGVTETDAFNKFIGPKENVQYIMCDNGIVSISSSDEYYTVTVMKYTGKQDNRFFRHIIPKNVVRSLLVSYSTNILTYRMAVGTEQTLYTSMYDLNTDNPYVPILSSADIFHGKSSSQNGVNEIELGISTLYYANGLLFSTEYNTNYESETDKPYILDESGDGILIKTSGKKLVRRVFFDEEVSNE